MWIRCYREETECSFIAWQLSQRRSTCFQINLKIKMIYCSSIICLEMWKSDSLRMHTVFFYSHMNSSSIAPSYKFPFSPPLILSKSQNSGFKAEARVTCLSNHLHTRDTTEHFDPGVPGLRWRPSQPSLVEPWTVSGHVSSLLRSPYLNVNKGSLVWFHITSSTTHPLL